MSHLIPYLFLLPIVADGGWANEVVTPPLQDDRGYPMRVASTAVPDPVAPAAPAVSPEGRQLPPPRRPLSGKGERSSPSTAGGALTTVVGSLALVLGVFFLVAWVTRKAAPRHLRPLPNEVIECLGRAPLAGRQQMQLVRLGKKLVLLSVTSTDARPLCEVTDPMEVDRLAGLCEQSRPESITANFRQVLAAAAAEPIPRGVLASAGLSSERPARAEGRPVGRERRP